jgi:predicted GNAT family acetyltransferase
MSARLAPRADEAGLETMLAYRRRGFGVTVTAAWAGIVQAEGRLALYSTSWDNAASQAVAARLGGRQYGEDFSIS